MSTPDEQTTVHPAKVDALVKKVNNIREEFDETVAELEAENDELRERVQDLEDKLSAVGADEMELNSPDKRALALRKWLYENANESQNGKVSLNKNEVRGVLGNIHREQRYEAMRRAAGGDDAARSGSSGLSPVQGIVYEKFDEPDRHSRVKIDLEEVQRKLGRRVIEMDDEGEGSI